MDLGKKSVTYFKNLSTPQADTAQTHLHGITHPSQEGLQDDKRDTTTSPQTIPKHILPARLRPQHHRPDLIRAIGYTLTPESILIKDHTYRGRRQLQIIECKYSTDGNIPEIIDHIHNLYEPPKIALQTHGKINADIKIIPIVITRTNTFNTKTLAEIAQLVSYKEEPPYVMTYKKLPKPAKHIAMSLHTYAQEWLSHISKHSRKILTTKQKTKAHAPITLT
jgi:hypothetical protein